MDESRVEWIGMSLVRAFAQSDEMGALPILYAATRPDLAGASYVGPRGPLGLRGYPKITTSSSASRDVATATRLWVASEELTGVSFDAGLYELEGCSATASALPRMLRHGRRSRA